MSTSLLKTAFFTASALALSTALHAETVLSQNNQNDLSVTLYQNGLGFIHDVRTAPLTGGKQTLAFEDISTQLIPDSLLIGGSGYEILERRFDFDLLTPAALLEKSIGKEVQFRKFNSVTGKDRLITAKILSTQGNIIIERDGKIEIGQPGNLVLDKMPDGLRARPALLATIKGDKKGDVPMVLAYLSNGLQWHASYSAEVAANGQKIALKSWANLTNTSGTDYNNAQLTLAAGQVNRRSMAKNVQLMARGAPAAMAMDSVAESAMAAPQALGGTYLYSLNERVNLGHQETKQVALTAPLNLKSKRILVKRFGAVYGPLHNNIQAEYPDIELSFTNQSDGPLPDGIVRLYQRDMNNQLQLIGEDNLQRTPKGNEATLQPGQSFDVTLKRKQTAFELQGKNSFDATYEIALQNAGKSDETVRIEQAFPGEWQLDKISHKTVEQANGRAVWEIKLPAEGKATLTYSVAVRVR